jgi:hypothetical protein
MFCQQSTNNPHRMEDCCLTFSTDHAEDEDLERVISQDSDGYVLLSVENEPTVHLC